MSKKQFKTTIDAPKEKVWNTLWQIDSYKNWTSAFSAESNVKTDNWKKGSKVMFLDGKGEGMVSEVAENIPNEFMSFHHLGMYKDGQEVKDPAETEKWGDALENYTLKTVGGKTELVVDMDISDEYVDYFNKTWPVALDKVKELAEKN
jgi:uncharacterized protein YndB with AHSA1/START domain